MATITSMSTNSKPQEQLNENTEDESDNKNLINVNENDADNGALTNTGDENRIASVSIGVGQDATSAINVKRETTVGDEFKYTGDIYAEKKHGEGVLSWYDGRIYTGAFYADRRHGFGTFQTPNISEFKGLYRHDERFGPGILSYKSSQSADVGLWLSEDLVRLLYPHPTLTLGLRITDKKPQIQSSFIIPSWYSPQELLTTIADFDFVLKKKTTGLFCKSIQDETSFLTHYLIDHSDGTHEAMHERRTQLDAYLQSLNDEEMLKEKILNERTADIVPPNETYEQRQLYYYTNKFWPLKQRATFTIDDIFSNTRSAFPNPGPLENSSLILFELAFNGQNKAVRDLLLRRHAYVDVCDSHGLTALHFATYNVHIDVVNILLDFGANVNQLSDDGLTPLTISFLLYYGNDPLQTINTALEHMDPVLLNPKPAPLVETGQSASKERLTQQSRASTGSSRNLLSRASTIDEEKLPSLLESLTLNEAEEENSYGYELTDELRERIRDEQYRESIHSLIKLLLRRGADPSLSDWPLPVLALAVRAGDKEMVELLLKKKAQVNCRLNAVRHANLTPLHIACGCLVPSAIDIVQLLLKHGAQVNAKSSPLSKEYLSLVDPLVIEKHKINGLQQHGRTPLHIACSRESAADTLSLVRLLLEHQANPNVVCNGQTPLSLAIAVGNEPLVDLLINHETTNPATTLGLGNGNALCTVLSTAYEPRWTYAQRLQLIEHLIAKNPQVLFPIRFGPKFTLGSSVDYAYYSFFADPRLSLTPFHSMSPQERMIYKDRKDLLSYIAKRFREEVSKHENFLRLPTPMSESPIETPTAGMQFLQRSVSRARSLMTEKTADNNSKASNEFHYCATCGRNTGVRLTPCKRCQKAYFCSKACKLAGWNAFHRDECQTPNLISPLNRPITTTKTVSSRNKLPGIRPRTEQTEHSQAQSVGSGTRFENFPALDGALFKENILSIASPPINKSDSRLPTLSVAKLIRQKRLRNLEKSGENFAPTLPACLKGIHLSWNRAYNAPENYSFN